ncbi:polysaccharide biosynthesis protein [Kiritimatiellaeota bacterium B1221]|nr:polysaccharide biosynthesis protein [Kiritimatiellaeota bacterium B1221]
MKYRILFILLHTLAGWLSLKLAFMLRFYFDPLPFRYDYMLLQTLPVAMIVKALAADGLGLTKRIWRYASFRDVKPVCLAALAGSAVFIPLAYGMEGSSYPNGPLLLDFLFTLSLFTAIRFSGRFWMEARRLLQGLQKKVESRVLILGAGEQGERALRFLQSENRVIGFLDEQNEIQGRLLLGLPVLGKLDDLAPVLKKKNPDEVVIALAHPGPERIRRVFEVGSSLGIRVSLMPERSPASEGNSYPIRELKMSDFLGREPVVLNPESLISSLGGMTVLVTGAGGSIGSELCRQIAALPVKKLLLLESSENALFEISEELKSGDGGRGAVGGLEVLLCDIRFREDLKAVFEKHRPDVVYHAAACKHVPMMELHPLDAARTNVLGTENVVALAKAFSVKRLLHVSTDKVVEAEGIMGASKAWGERVVRAAGYSCVRFGNVLGSSGSVIPLFEKQWSRQGQLQVTHREATRYFMTIEEAVLLILHAEALQGSGEVYILDMGEPVKILDLAKQVVALKGAGRSGTGVGGQEPAYGQGGRKSEEEDKSLHGIEIVGLRPGERIHERLHTPEEKLEATNVPKVNKLSGTFEAVDLDQCLAELKQAVADRDVDEIRKILLG